MSNCIFRPQRLRPCLRNITIYYLEYILIYFSACTSSKCFIYIIQYVRNCPPIIFYTNLLLSFTFQTPRLIKIIWYKIYHCVFIIIEPSLWKKDNLRGVFNKLFLFILATKKMYQMYSNSSCIYVKNYMFYGKKIGLI